MSQVVHSYVSNRDVSRRDFGAPAKAGKAGPVWTSRRPQIKSNRQPIQTNDYDDREVPGLEDTVRQLFHMTLASLRGYREISRLVLDPALQTCVDVLVQQRAAQCRALAQMSQSLHLQLNLLGMDNDSLADPAAADLQLVWLRTIWTFEQEEFGRFADNIEQAEAILEDAFLSAAQAFQNTGVATVFRQFAMNICGARQRLEELVVNLGSHR